MTELIMCKFIRYMYYCEEVFVVKHKIKVNIALPVPYSMTLV